MDDIEQKWIIVYKWMVKNNKIKKENVPEKFRIFIEEA